MQYEYQWREGSRISGLQPAIVGSVLEEMEKQRGSVNPKALVEDARKKSHTLHDYFVWQNTIAGNLWREEQARKLISALKVKVIRVREEDEELPEPIIVKVFIPESVAAEEGEGKPKEYRSILNAPG